MDGSDPGTGAEDRLNVTEPAGLQRAKQKSVYVDLTSRFLPGVENSIGTHLLMRCIFFTNVEDA